MIIRDWRYGEEETLWHLFHDTVHTVNGRDYAPDQLAAWAPDVPDMFRWTQRIQAIRPFVVEDDGSIIGYSDVQDDGLVDHFYVAAHRQGQGIGRRLMVEIHRRAKQQGVSRLYSHVSMTARPFFEKMGFRVQKAQDVILKGIVLRNYLMTKTLVGEK